MPRLRILILAILSLITISPGSLAAKDKSSPANSSFAKYVEIPGASRVGADACTTCHSDVAKGFRHAFHAQQGVECEDCHGPGSLHVNGNGDVTKIIRFSARPPDAANGVCLSCHVSDAGVRNWATGPHASNKVRCTDCHQTHTYGAKAGSTGEEAFDKMNPGRVNLVEDVVPETKVIVQPRQMANDACLKCHASQRGQMSLPYHHPLLEGKMIGDVG